MPLPAGDPDVEFPIRFGKFELVERIAAGGMAEVFRAVARGAEGFEKEVCIKRILPMFGEDPEFVTMFIDEATLACKLHHANIVQIFDFDKVDGRYYIAMELVEGRDLKRLLNSLRQAGRAFPVELAAFVAAELLKGLHYAHSRRQGGQSLNIIHRDISPHNVLCSMSGEVKITDFGIAKAATRASITRSGVVKGKIVYMSPEQALGQPVDSRSDLFAAGVVLYELATGARPFIGKTDAETLAKIQRGEFQLPSAVRPEVSKKLEVVICKLMARDPAQRYATGGDALRDLGSEVPADGGMQLADLMHSMVEGPVAVSKRVPTEVLSDKPRLVLLDPPVIPADSAAVTRTRGPREEPEALAFLDTQVATPSPTDSLRVDPEPPIVRTAASMTAQGGWKEVTASLPEPSLSFDPGATFVPGVPTTVSGPPDMVISEPIPTVPATPNGVAASRPPPSPEVLASGAVVISEPIPTVPATPNGIASRPPPKGSATAKATAPARPKAIAVRASARRGRTDPAPGAWTMGDGTGVASLKRRSTGQIVFVAGAICAIAIVAVFIAQKVSQGSATAEPSLPVVAPITTANETAPVPLAAAAGTAAASAGLPAQPVAAGIPGKTPPESTSPGIRKGTEVHATEHLPPVVLPGPPSTPPPPETPPQAPAEASPPVAGDPGPATPAPPAEPQFGFVRVNVHPWAKVTVNGRPIGMTPTAEIRVSAGPLRIVLEQDGREPAVRNEQIRPGEHRSLTYTLPP